MHSLKSIFAKSRYLRSRPSYESKELLRFPALFSSLALPMELMNSFRASRLPWLATPSSWDSFCQSRAAWPPAVPALSGKRKCFRLSPLTQTFKSKHSEATGRVRINKMQERKALPQETKGVFKKLPLLSKEEAAKPQQFHWFVCTAELGGGGHRPLKRKCHPWYRQPASPQS